MTEGFRSPAALWIGGAGNPPAVLGFRSLAAFWIGGSGNFGVPQPVGPVAFSIVQPVAIEFQHWASTVVIDLPQQFIPEPPHERNWQDWANSVIQLNSFGNQGVPPPDKYAQWQDWAWEFYRAMYPSNQGNS